MQHSISSSSHAVSGEFPAPAENKWKFVSPRLQNEAAVVNTASKNLLEALRQHPTLKPLAIAAHNTGAALARVGRNVYGEAVNVGQEVGEALGLVEKSSLSAQMKRGLIKLGKGFEKLWAAVVAPILAALGTGTVFLYNVIKLGVKTAFLPIVFLGQLLIDLCSKMLKKDFSEAKKSSQVFIEKNFVEFIATFSGAVLSNTYTAFKDSLTEGQLKPAMDHFATLEEGIMQIVGTLIENKSTKKDLFFDNLL
ncbi:MAG: hypothetical protein WCN87_04815 [Chlamydiota bacterium]